MLLQFLFVCWMGRSSGFRVYNRTTPPLQQACTSPLLLCSYLYRLIRRPLKVSCPCWTSHWSVINMVLSLDIDRGPHCAPRDLPPRFNELHNELSSKYRKKLLKAHIKNAHKSLLRQDSQIYSTPFVKSRNLHVEPRYKWR